MRCRLVALLLFALAASRFLQRYVVRGESMTPAFKPGDRLIAESLSYRLRPPRAGDAVIVRQPGSKGRKDLKRIAAAPGATVEGLHGPHTLAADEWFVLGDNLDASTDSRSLGPVPRGDILGRVWFKY